MGTNTGSRTYFENHWFGSYAYETNTFGTVTGY